MLPRGSPDVPNRVVVPEDPCPRGALEGSVSQKLNSRCLPEGPQVSYGKLPVGQFRPPGLNSVVSEFFTAAGSPSSSTPQEFTAASRHHRRSCNRLPSAVRVKGPWVRWGVVFSFSFGNDNTDLRCSQKHSSTSLTPWRLPNDGGAHQLIRPRHGACKA